MGREMSGLRQKYEVFSDCSWMPGFWSDKSRLSSHLIVVVNKGNYCCGKDVGSYNNTMMKLYYKHCRTVWLLFFSKYMTESQRWAYLHLHIVSDIYIYIWINLVTDRCDYDIFSDGDMEVWWWQYFWAHNTTLV